MKFSICFLIILYSQCLWAQVDIHGDVFFNIPAGQGDQYWSRVYDWSAWAETQEQKELQLTSNYVKKAYATGGKRYDLAPLTLEEFSQVLGPYEGEALFDFYSNREEVEEILLDGTPKGAVVIAKVQVDLDPSLDIESLTLDKIIALIQKSDAPHIHKEVSGKWAHRMLDPVHDGHAELENHGTGKVLLSLINTGEDYYKCTRLNSALGYYSELSEISLYDEDYRAHLINIVDEVSDFSKLPTVVDKGAKKVFIQKTIYTSNLIKSGVNYLSFYEENGSKKLIMTSVLVSTNKVFLNANVLNIYINSMSLLELLGRIELVNGVAHLDAKNLSLGAAEESSCQQGLGLGVANYIYNMALKLKQFAQ